MAGIPPHKTIFSLRRCDTHRHPARTLALMLELMPM
jgi:hypothetical protein